MFLYPQIKAVDMKTAFVERTKYYFINNKDTFLILGDIGHFGFREIWEDSELNERYINIGILEQSMVGFSAGIAKSGYYPIIHTITPFLVERPFEQIKVDFSLNKLKGCFISVGGCYDYSTLGPTHHSYTDLGLFSSLNGTHVYSPSSEAELDQAMNSCMRNRELAYIRMNRSVHNLDLSRQLNGEKSPHLYKLKSGTNLTIVSTGGRTKDLLDCVRSLPLEISSKIEVFHISKVKPLCTLDIEKSISKTGSLLVLEDHSFVGSLYARIISQIDSNVRFSKNHLCVEESMLDGYGTYDDLAIKAGVGYTQINQKIMELLS